MYNKIPVVSQVNNRSHRGALNSSYFDGVHEVQSERPRFFTSLPKASCSSSSTRAFVPSVLLTNAQSLVNKLDEAEVIFKQNNIDICIISETWFHSDLPEHVLNINNYVCVCV